MAKTMNLRSWVFVAALFTFPSDGAKAATPPRTQPCSGLALALERPAFREQAVQLAGEPVIAGTLFGADVEGNDPAGLLIVSLSTRQIQILHFDQAHSTYLALAPRPLPADCPFDGVQVADLEGNGHDELIGFHAGLPHLWHIPLDRTGNPLHCFSWGSVPPSQTLEGLYIARRFHRRPDAVTGFTQQGTRIVWEFRSPPVVTSAPFFADWDQRKPSGAVSLAPDDQPGILECRPNFTRCAVVTNSAELYHSSWVTLRDEGTNYAPLLLGDFDGDRQTDALTYETQLGGWYIGFGEERASVEIAAHGLPRRPPPEASLTVADVNHDGRSDLVLLHGDRRSLRLFSSEAARPLAGVRIINDQGELVTESGDTGSLTLPLNGSGRLHPVKDGFDFSPQTFAASSVCQVLRAEPQPPPGTPQHRAFRRAGDDAGPYLCTGYLLGPERRWGMTVTMCPAGYAVYAAEDTAGKWPSIRAVPLQSDCCRVPTADIFTGKTSLSPIECPENSVAIGAQQSYFCPDCDKNIVCAEINTARYTLGPPQPGGYWGLGRNIRWMNRRIEPRDMPLAIRYGVGRLSERSWDTDGCVGTPYGSLLTRKGQLCDDQRYRQLLYKGAAGDPPAGTPVAMLPDCDSLADVYNPLAGCRDRPTAPAAVPPSPLTPGSAQTPPH